MLQLFIALLAIVVSTHAQGQVHPCHGVHRGWQPVLNACQSFWRCEENPPTIGSCRQNEFFDVNSQQCVQSQNRRCFACPFSGYALFSMPRACHQFIRCWNGRSTLHTCPNGMVFDGRTGVRQCNWIPGNGGCHSSGWGIDGIGGNSNLCPSVVNNNGLPLYLRARGSCGRYFVCWAPNIQPLSGSCPAGLHFNIRSGVCDRPANVICDEEVRK